MGPNGRIPITAPVRGTVGLVPEPLETPFTWTASDRMFKAMTLRGWDQQDLIRETGLNKNTVSKVMPRKGDPVPDLSRLNEVTWRALANALGVPIGYLRDGE